METDILQIGTEKIIIHKYQVADGIRVAVSQIVPGYRSFHVYVAADPKKEDEAEAILDATLPKNVGLSALREGKVLTALGKDGQIWEPFYLVKAKRGTKNRDAGLKFENYAQHFENRLAFFEKEYLKSPSRGEVAPDQSPDDNPLSGRGPLAKRIGRSRNQLRR